jgi:hypothetical protein
MLMKKIGTGKRKGGGSLRRPFTKAFLFFVMPAFSAGIHVLFYGEKTKTRGSPARRPKGGSFY